MRVLRRQQPEQSGRRRPVGQPAGADHQGPDFAQTPCIDFAGGKAALEKLAKSRLETPLKIPAQDPHLNLR